MSKSQNPGKVPVHTKILNRQDQNEPRCVAEIPAELRPRSGGHPGARRHHPEARREERAPAPDRRVRREGRDQRGLQGAEEEGDLIKLRQL